MAGGGGKGQAILLTPTSGGYSLGIFTLVVALDDVQHRFVLTIRCHQTLGSTSSVLRYSPGLQDALVAQVQVPQRLVPEPSHYTPSPSGCHPVAVVLHTQQCSSMHRAVTQCSGKHWLPWCWWHWHEVLMLCPWLFLQISTKSVPGALPHSP